jgi:DNA-binding response OmpR family regulator
MAGNGVILLIDNDTVLLRNNRSALEKHRYTVYTAETIKEAENCMKKTEPDLVIMEVELPDGDGFAFCRKIYGTSFYIFFLTSKSGHEDMLRGLAVGGDDYIIKPAYTDELIARVRGAMRRRNAHVQLIRG